MFKWLERILVAVVIVVTAIDSIHYNRLSVNWNLVVSISGMLVFARWGRKSLG